MATYRAEIIAVASLFLLLAWVAVGLRIYCRTFLVRSFGNDDKVMVILLLLFTVYTALQIYGGTRGIGLPDNELSVEGRRESLRLWWILELMNVCSTCLLKISVGYFLLRVAIDRIHIWIIWLLMAGTVVFGTTYLLMIAFQCRPISTYWNESPRAPDKCWSRQVIYVMTIAATVINTGADFVFGTLPWFIVRSMNMPTGTKIVVVGILGLAAIGSTATIVRAFYIPTLLEGTNFLHATANFALWSTVEPGIGIVAASIATLRPLYQLIIGRTGRASGNVQRDVWRRRQQARRNETSRQVRAAHNLDAENPPVDSDFTSPRGIHEVNPPAVPQLSKNTNSTVKSRATDNGTTSEQILQGGGIHGDGLHGGGTQGHGIHGDGTAGDGMLTRMEFPPPLDLSEDFRRTMERPPEEWIAMIRADEASEARSRLEAEFGSPLSLVPPQVSWWPPSISPLPWRWSLRTQRSTQSLRSVRSAEGLPRAGSIKAASDK
ncbi:hypothetical protein C8035_v003878 [Colletotrichum spinosum]|uniref:Rhodopsin domain-containing protein n=1 Tax=Colletotrichum spinosum TaxID=1347390 RepID=A0A4R8PSW7_9PEZI|nr:hypothetical protein C8035_v003878 [Colletotrichum spinosum]